MQTPHIVHRQRKSEQADVYAIEFWTGEGWSFDPDAAQKLTGESAIHLISALLPNHTHSYAVTPA